MKVYFSKKTQKVIRVKENERDGKPYCNTEEYRKNFSDLNKTEQEAYNEFITEENWKAEEEDRINRKMARGINNI